MRRCLGKGEGRKESPQKGEGLREAAIGRHSFCDQGQELSTFIENRDSKLRCDRS